MAASNIRAGGLALPESALGLWGGGCLRASPAACQGQVRNSQSKSLYRSDGCETLSSLIPELF